MTLGVTVNGRHFGLFAPTGSSSDWRWLLGRKRDRAVGINKVLQLIWVKMMVPKTKSRTLETIQQKLGFE